MELGQQGAGAVDKRLHFLGRWKAEVDRVLHHQTQQGRKLGPDGAAGHVGRGPVLASHVAVVGDHVVAKREQCQDVDVTRRGAHCFQLVEHLLFTAPIRARCHALWRTSRTSGQAPIPAEKPMVDRIRVRIKHECRAGDRLRASI